jgi:hypothetical protein
MIHMPRWIISGVTLLLATAAAWAEEPATLWSCTCAHNVADLVVPLDNYTLPVVKLWKQRHPDKRHMDITAEEALIDLVTHTIAPGTWCDDGGKGTIEYYPLGLYLVVHQRQEVHEQIVDLLQSIRKMMREMSLECKLVKTDIHGRLHKTRMPKITFLVEQDVQLNCEPKRGTRINLGVRTEPSRRSAVKVALAFEEWCKSKVIFGDQRGAVVNNIQQLETVLIVHPGQTTRLPLDGRTEDETSSYLEFTLLDAEKEEEFQGNVPRIPR